MKRFILVVIIGYNPLGLAGVLAYWSARAIRTTYLNKPGPLVQA